MALSEVFLTMLVTSSFAFLGATLAVCYKSKCIRISCCGLVIDRDVQGEEQIDTEELRHRHDASRMGDSSTAQNAPHTVDV
jgi:hypothetical protein